jgi:hypothetical protein
MGYIYNTLDNLSQKYIGLHNISFKLGRVMQAIPKPRRKTIFAPYYNNI